MPAARCPVCQRGQSQRPHGTISQANSSAATLLRRCTMDLEVARNFLIALLIGALVGVEREKKKDSDSGPFFGGIRTYTLLALVGAASAWLTHEGHLPWAFHVTLAIVGAAMVASYVLQNRGRDDSPGLTSEVAAIAVCLLGGMVVMGEAPLAVALAVVTSAVLAYKQPLHGLIGRIGRDDLLAGIKLFIASFIVLPLLPNETIDPWGAINPYKLWLLVILISALSLVGYAAMRWLGTAHGTAITGLAGGLVSSTATTLSFARTSRTSGDATQARALTAGTLLAWGVMFVRMVVLIAVVNRPLLLSSWLPFTAMGVVTLGLAGWHYRAGIAGATVEDGKSAPEVKNPFSLSAAIRFGLLFAAVLLVVKLAETYASDVGVYVVAALAGSVDVDAITLSVAGQPGDLSRAATAIVIAALSNTVVKCSMAAVLGASGLRRHIVIATVAILAAGFAGVALQG